MRNRGLAPIALSPLPPAPGLFCHDSPAAAAHQVILYFRLASPSSNVRLDGAELDMFGSQRGNDDGSDHNIIYEKALHNQDQIKNKLKFKFLIGSPEWCPMVFAVRWCVNVFNLILF